MRGRLTLEKQQQQGNYVCVEERHETGEGIVDTRPLIRTSAG